MKEPKVRCEVLRFQSALSEEHVKFYNLIKIHTDDVLNYEFYTTSISVYKYQHVLVEPKTHHGAPFYALFSNLPNYFK